MFAKFDDFSKWSMPKLQWNFEKSSKCAKNLGRNEEIPCSNCGQSISWDFWVPGPSLDRLTPMLLLVLCPLESFVNFESCQRCRNRVCVEKSMLAMMDKAI